MRANAARALGHLSGLIDIPQLALALLACLESPVPKAQWNACYALASALTADRLKEPISITLTSLWKTLAALIRNAAHFKVRIA